MTLAPYFGTPAHNAECTAQMVGRVVWLIRCLSTYGDTVAADCMTVSAGWERFFEEAYRQWNPMGPPLDIVRVLDRPANYDAPRADGRTWQQWARDEQHGNWCVEIRYVPTAGEHGAVIRSYSGIIESRFLKSTDPALSNGPDLVRLVGVTGIDYKTYPIPAATFATYRCGYEGIQPATTVDEQWSPDPRGDAIRNRGLSLAVIRSLGWARSRNQPWLDVWDQAPVLTGAVANGRFVGAARVSTRKSKGFWTGQPIPNYAFNADLTVDTLAELHGLGVNGWTRLAVLGDYTATLDVDAAGCTDFRVVTAAGVANKSQDPYVIQNIPPIAVDIATGLRVRAGDSHGLHLCVMDPMAQDGIVRAGHAEFRRLLDDGSEVELPDDYIGRDGWNCTIRTGIDDPAETRHYAAWKVNDATGDVSARVYADVTTNARPHISDLQAQAVAVIGQPFSASCLAADDVGVAIVVFSAAGKAVAAPRKPVNGRWPCTGNWPAVITQPSVNAATLINGGPKVVKQAKMMPAGPAVLTAIASDADKLQSPPLTAAVQVSCDPTWTNSKPLVSVTATRRVPNPKSPLDSVVTFSITCRASAGHALTSVLLTLANGKTYRWNIGTTAALESLTQAIASSPWPGPYLPPGSKITVQVWDDADPMGNASATTVIYTVP